MKMPNKPMRASEIFRIDREITNTGRRDLALQDIITGDCVSWDKKTKAIKPRKRVILSYHSFAEQTAFGLALHPVMTHTPAESIYALHGYWQVSDPVTGYRICLGAFPGRLGAIAALVQLAVKHKPFAEQLAERRKKIKKEFKEIKGEWK
jgi:hypothetical protein